MKRILIVDDSQKWVDFHKIALRKVFAGKGTKVAIKDRFHLEADYKIAADKWQKVSGNAYIILKGKKQKAELHWYEADGEIFEMKAKRYIDES